MVITEPIPGIRVAESQIKMPLTQLPARMTVVDLPSGGVLISPLPKTSPETFRACGPVTDIVAPNLFHHLGLRRALEAFPKARLWGAEGFSKKRPDLKFTAWLSPQSWPYAHELPLIVLRGVPAMNEAVFFHRASKTLICTDLCSNLHGIPGWGARIIFGLFGTDNRFAMSRLVKLFNRDREAFQKSLEAIFAWDFENIVMAHGQILLGDGKSRLRQALSERGINIQA